MATSDYVPTLAAPATPSYSFLLPPAADCRDTALASHRASGYGTLDGVPAVPSAIPITQADRDACAACAREDVETVAAVISVDLDFPSAAAQVCLLCAVSSDASFRSAQMFDLIWFLSYVRDRLPRNSHCGLRFVAAVHTIFTPNHFKPILCWSGRLQTFVCTLEGAADVMRGVV